MPPYDTSNPSQTQTFASEVSQETIELKADEHDKRIRERNLKGHLEWCDSMDGMDPSEMVDKVMRNINAFVLKKRKIKLHKEAQDLFRSVLEKEKEMPEYILRMLEGGSPTAKGQLKGFRDLQEATKDRTLWELSHVLSPLDLTGQILANEACRWLYRAETIIESFCRGFGVYYKERLSDPSTIAEGAIMLVTTLGRPIGPESRALLYKRRSQSP